MTQWPILSYEAAIDRLSRLNEKRNYYAMFSSLLGGIVTDPELMLIPIDDHMVHRGDGVFEAIKCTHNRIYALDEHLERLEKSAEQISLKLPFSRAEIKKLCCDTTRIGLNYARTDSAMLRLFVSRGPGSFTPNPYESLGSQLYLVITPWKAVAEEKYQSGVKTITSKLEVKSSMYAQIKSCNYLPNVLLKKESVDKAVDYAIGIDEAGRVAEGPTENFAIVSQSGVLLAPSFERTLKGITLRRVFEFCPLVSELQGYRIEKLSLEDVMLAKEAFMVGTTLDVLPVTSIDGTPVNTSGEVGPIAKKLRELFLKDQSGEDIGGLSSLSLLV
jgi:4-amino-4-deoxychorismate lyase